MVINMKFNQFFNLGLAAVLVSSQTLYSAEWWQRAKQEVKVVKEEGLSWWQRDKVQKKFKNRFQHTTKRSVAKRSERRKTRRFRGESKRSSFVFNHFVLDSRVQKVQTYQSLASLNKATYEETSDKKHFKNMSPFMKLRDKSSSKKSVKKVKEIVVPKQKPNKVEVMYSEVGRKEDRDYVREDVELKQKNKFHEKYIDDSLVLTSKEVKKKVKNKKQVLGAWLKRSFGLKTEKQDVQPKQVWDEDTSKFPIVYVETETDKTLTPKLEGRSLAMQQIEKIEAILTKENVKEKTKEELVEEKEESITKLKDAQFVIREKKSENNPKLSERLLTHKETVYLYKNLKNEFALASRNKKQYSTVLTPIYKNKNILNQPKKEPEKPVLKKVVKAPIRTARTIEMPDRLKLGYEKVKRPKHFNSLTDIFALRRKK